MNCCLFCKFKRVWLNKFHSHEFTLLCQHQNCWKTLCLSYTLYLILNHDRNMIYWKDISSKNIDTYHMHTYHHFISDQYDYRQDRKQQLHLQSYFVFWLCKRSWTFIFCFLENTRWQRWWPDKSRLLLFAS